MQQGKWHTNAIADHAICGDTLVSCGLDDTFRTADLSKMEVVRSKEEHAT